MSNVLKLSGALGVGQLGTAPVNPQAGYIFFDTNTGTFKFYQNGSFRQVDAEGLAAHLTDDAALKHDADEIDYQRADGLRKNIKADATSPNVELALDDLDDAIGDLSFGPVNYTPADAAIVADHLAAIDDYLGGISITPEFLDTEFRIQDDGDPTKQIAFQASTIATGTTRTITMPDANVNLADVNNAILKDGSRAFTAAQSFGGFKATNVADPTTAQDAATKAYVDAVAQGLRPKQAVRVGTTANVSIANGLEAGDVIDGITLVAGDRVLVKNQSTASQNGIYVASSSGAASRASDFDSLSPIDEVNGAYTFIQEGTQAGQGWVQQGTVATLGTDAVVFVYFQDAASIVGGDMISVTGQTISVDLASNSGLESTNPGNNAGQLRIKADATGGAGLAKAINLSANGVAIKVDDSTIEDNGSGSLRVKDAGITDAKIATGIDAVKIGAGGVSNTEFGYLDGVTSAIQTQLNGKLSNVSEDTTPELGGNLDVSGFAIEGSASEVLLAGQNSVRRAKQASKTNFIEEEYIHSTALAGSQTNVTISAFTFAFASFDALEITYKIKQTTTNSMRVGTLRIITDGTTVAINDVWTDTADLGISFSAVINGSNVELKYSSGTNGGTMRADVKKLKT